MRYIKDIITVSDSITSGAASSAGKTSGPGSTVLALVLEGTYTNTSFDVEINVGGSWLTLFDSDGNKVTITVADGVYPLPAEAMLAAEQVRVTGSSNEAAARTVKWVTGRLQ